MSATAISALLGFLGVALGAFGAHSLQAILLANDTVSMWQTAVLYHLLHAVAALVMAERRPVVTWVWTLGILLFSGSLYVFAVTKFHWLVYITPLGGILLLVGWAMLFKPAK